jgi:hypothetical protein
MLELVKCGEAVSADQAKAIERASKGLEIMRDIMSLIAMLHALGCYADTSPDLFRAHKETLDGLGNYLKVIAEKL